MPDDKCQLGHLLPFLAKLHQRRLSASRVQEFCHPDKHLAILLADSTVHSGDRICKALSAHSANSSSTLRGVRSAAAAHVEATIMLLLGCGGGGLDLSMLLGDEGGMLLLVLGMRLSRVVLLLLVLLLLLLLVLQPRGISLRVLMLMREDVLALRL